LARYAVRLVGSWQAEYVDSSGTGSYLAALYPSLEIDSSGRPVAALSAWSSPHRLVYAVRTGPHWTYETVDSSVAGPNGRCDLELDPAGRPHIGYYDVSSPPGGYARWNGSAWIFEAHFDWSGTSRFLLDGSGAPHAVYWDPVLEQAYYDRPASPISRSGAIPRSRCSTRRARGARPSRPRGSRGPFDWG
jgi:hypothetical protein